jgi:hypothetical protein
MKMKVSVSERKFWHRGFEVNDNFTEYFLSNVEIWTKYSSQLKTDADASTDADVSFGSNSYNIRERT